MRYVIKEALGYLVVALVLIGLFIGFSLLFSVWNARSITKENNSYIRVVACVSSVSPSQRTPDYVKLCYVEAEKHNDVKLERFGHGK